MKLEQLREIVKKVNEISMDTIKGVPSGTDQAPGVANESTPDTDHHNGAEKVTGEGHGDILGVEIPETY